MVPNFPRPLSVIFLIFLGNIVFLWEGLRALYFLGYRREILSLFEYDGKVIQLGQSIRVTLTSHEGAQLAEISEHIYFMLYSDLKTRWSQILHFPVEILRPPSYFGGSKTDIQTRV